MPCGLDTDLYQLTMMAGYWAEGLTTPATFELFVRRLPDARGYLMAAGLEPAIAYLEQLSFSADDRAWLKALPQFARVPAAFFDEYLAHFSFHGEVWAVAEGTPVFANEPILRVTAALPEAQLVETMLLAFVSFQTSVATKAARLVQAAQGRPVIEFGARRAHGPGAAHLAARAAYLGGCDGTSFVDAARLFDIPASGTMAHSWVQAFPTEDEAFAAFERHFGDRSVYLLDTYDTVGAAERLAASDLRPRFVRLDSGDLVALSRRVRAILDAAGLRDTRIFATSDLDEFVISELLDAGAPLDAFGVGTALSTVNDAPALSAVYKLVEIERSGRRSGVIKLSAGKHTWPRRKQVWRTLVDGQAACDVIAADDEPPPADSVALLEPVMRGGRRIGPPPSIADARARGRAELARLPEAVRRLTAPGEYEVRISDALERARDRLEGA